MVPLNLYNAAGDVVATFRLGGGRRVRVEAKEPLAADLERVFGRTPADGERYLDAVRRRYARSSFYELRP